MKTAPVFFLGLLTVIISCNQQENGADAFGNFEAVETTVSSEAAGRLLLMNVEEGDELDSGLLVALVDTSQLHLQKLQLEATLGTLPRKLREAEPEIAVLEDQKRNLIRERDRVLKLLEDKAATPKQLDDLNGEIEVVNQRMAAAGRQTAVANRGILSEKEPILAQIDVINDKLQKCYIRNPVSGTVLTKLAENAEIVGFGTPLYKIANLEYMTLRAYASAVQMQNVSIGQSVKVLTDDGEAGYREWPGEITWISREAEFTPKTIQTKEERVNLVYAFKVLVKNDGKLKIGMPAEVVFN